MARTQHLMVGLFFLFLEFFILFPFFFLHAASITYEQHSPDTTIVQSRVRLFVRSFMLASIIYFERWRQRKESRKKELKKKRNNNHWCWRLQGLLEHVS